MKIYLYFIRRKNGTEEVGREMKLKIIFISLTGKTERSGREIGGRERD